MVASARRKKAQLKLSVLLSFEGSSPKLLTSPLANQPTVSNKVFKSYYSIDTIFVEHYNSVMKNVTITPDEDVARWARIRAAAPDTSLSRLVGDLLREKTAQEETHQEARQHYLAQPPVHLKGPEGKYPRRDELHER